MSSHWKSLRWSWNLSKKPGWSSFGAYIVTKVISFSLVLISHIMNLPILSKKDLWSWKVKLLLKRIATPPLGVEYEVNRDLRLHSEAHKELAWWFLNYEFPGVDKLSIFFARSQLKTPLLFNCSPKPRTLSEHTLRSVIMKQITVKRRKASHAEPKGKLTNRNNVFWADELQRKRQKYGYKTY